MDWKNLILGAAGVGLAPFTGGASLALTGAAIAAHGAKSSADTLAKGADQAVAVQSQQKQAAQQKLDTTQAQQAQLYAPYTALGAGAASSLGQRMGLPAVPTSGNLPVSGSPVSASGAGLQPGTLGATSSVPTGPAAEGALVSSDARSRGTLASIGSAVQRQAAQQQTQSGYVTMRAPDGTTGQVPQHQVSFYTAKGAQVVA